MALVVGTPCWSLPGIKKKAGKRKKGKERGSTFQLLGRILGHLDVNHPLESKEKALVKIPLGTNMSWLLWKTLPAPSLTDPRPGKNLDRKNKNRNFGVSRAVIPTGNSAGRGGLLLDPVLAFLILIPNPIPHPMPQDVLPPAQGSLWIPCFPHGWKVCGGGSGTGRGSGMGRKRGVGYTRKSGINKAWNSLECHRSSLRDRGPGQPTALETGNCEPDRKSVV